MPIKLSLEVDQGFKKFETILQNELDGLKSFKDLWKMIIDLFDGKISGYKSPITQIYESNGSLISGNWDITNEIYKEWKGKNWEGKREFDVPVSGNHLQVLTGATLHSLLYGDDSNAIREIEDKTMVYGTKVKQGKYNQENKHILDFYPGMVSDINSVVGLYINQLSKEAV